MDLAALPHAGALAAGPLHRWLAAHAVPGLERHDAATGEHTRAVPDGRGGWQVVTVRPVERPGGGAVLAAPRSAAHLPAVRRWLALDDDTTAADAALAGDPVLGPLVTARPGLRLPGAVDATETAVLTVLGQHVSLAAARTFAGRLVAALGEPVGGGLVRFPDPGALTGAGPEALRALTGVTSARATAVHALAGALDGGLDLRAGQPPAARVEARRALLALPGIGPWTADYIGLRVLRDPDAFLGGDLVLRRALGVRTPREAEERAQAWRPWRGHALVHLWTREVFA